QAEDGIRYRNVTGVQTCALPISDNRTKIDVINKNTHKYSVSAMCKVLQMPRSTYYYHQNNQHKVNKENNDEILADEIEDIFISRSEERRVGKECKTSMRGEC